ncbi:MAG: hypothetical protein K2K97_03430 [Muribaculaceae bacterium]|nr:hypothetical protein [Muribaculaceae bacterium]
MRTRIFKLMCLIGILMPMYGEAQTNVQKAFNELLKSSDLEYSETHTLDKDTETGVKESQSDIYNFTLPASQFKLIENIQKAFREDENKAYSLSGGRADKNSPQIQLAVGSGQVSGVYINPPGYDYYYACYLAPKSEDESGIYRYAYGINWRKSKDKIEGMLAVTYATTLKYRQSSSYSTQQYVQSLTPLGGYAIGNTASTWFNTMVSYIQTLSSEDAAGSNGQQVLAAKIFKQAQLSQTLKGVSDEDKNAIRELLKTMLSDTSKYDPLAIKLLNSALINIK